MWFVLYMFGGIFLEKKLDFKDPAFFLFFHFMVLFVVILGLYYYTN